MLIVLNQHGNKGRSNGLIYEYSSDVDI